MQGQQAPQAAAPRESTGISDDIPAMLSEGEFVINAEQVSKLGGGATDPGIKFLEQLMGIVDSMDRETAVLFSDSVALMGETLLDEQPKIEEE